MGLAITANYSRSVKWKLSHNKVRMRRMLSLAPLSTTLTGQWLTASSQWCWYQASASYGWCCASDTTKFLLVNDVVVMNTMESWWQRNSHYWTDWSRVKLSCLERCFITELMGECLQVRVFEQCNWCGWRGSGSTRITQPRLDWIRPNWFLPILF